MNKELGIFITDSSISLVTLDRMFKTRTKIVQDIKLADVVLFTGGADVSPEFYNHSKSKHTAGTNLSRDIKEFHYFKEALRANKKMVGICRGAQFLCVMAGGALIQHVDNHGIDHNIELMYDPFNDGATQMRVTSTHHQMMDLREIDDKHYLLLGYSISRSDVYISDEDKCDKESLLKWSDKMFKNIGGVIEPEMVMFSNINAMCMQFHPEYDHFYTDTKFKSNTDKKSIDYVADWLSDFMDIKKTADVK